MAYTRGRRSPSLTVGFALAAVGALLTAGCGSDIPELFPRSTAGDGGSVASAGRLSNGGAPSGSNSGGATTTAGGADAGGSAGTGGASAPSAGLAGRGDGGGGGAPDDDCDDANACTTDLRDAQGCRHTPVVCSAPSACQTAVCEPASGCATQNAPDGAACDDARPCTSSDVCAAGMCSGKVPTTELEESVMADIPDGQEMCHGVRGELAVTFQASSPVQVGTLSLDIDFRHPYVSEIRIALRHEASGRSARVLWNPEAPNSRVEGSYSFADDAADFPIPNAEGETIEPGKYAPLDEFAEAFRGVTMEGSWTLLFSDSCENDVGAVQSATLRLRGEDCP